MKVSICYSMFNREGETKNHHSFLKQSIGHAAMKMLPPTTPFFDVTSEVILPSWGDPILSQSLEALNEDISLSPISSNEWLSSENENECLPILIKDPRLESEMTSLMDLAIRYSNKYENWSLQEFNGLSSTVMERDDNACCEREDNSTSRCLVDESFETESVYSMTSGSSSQEREMEIEAEEASIQSSAAVYSNSNTEWSVEMFYRNNLLSFKLRTSTGACMHLMADEILDSLTALVEDAMERDINFRIVRIDGKIILVDWTLVVPVVTKILEGCPKKLAPQTGIEPAIKGMDLDVNEAIKKENSPLKRKGLKMPGLSRQKTKDHPANRKDRIQIGSKRKAVSARAKIRPRPGTRME